ncbi:MAG TPA: outer membrane lipoprotein chaperone LolA [Burkholderiales bacterium]|nr:outer membrane lipoprotein chaperone LolA [Burkholderiales bacterium]
MPQLILLLITLFFYATGCRADGIAALQAFIADTHSAQADFSQTVLDKAGKIKQQSAGTMVFSRPGKFRWTYETPFKQIIVGDGKKIYLYDTDLEQVTIKHYDTTLGSSPAALLAGDNAIEKFYVLTDTGNSDGLTWLKAVPKDRDSAFRQIEMGFDRNTLTEMKILDNFGLTTVLRLNRLQRNPKLPAGTFKFVPPAGVDVLSDSK